MTDEFELMGNDPGTWKTVAEALVYNAEVLKKHHYRQYEQGNTESDAFVAVCRLFCGELLLWGYALEAFLKCLYLKAHFIETALDVPLERIGFSCHLEFGIHHLRITLQNPQKPL